MSAVPEPSKEVRGVIAGAHGAAMRAGTIGTEHLLVALAGVAGAGRAKWVLGAAQLTGAVAMAMLHRRGPDRVEAWQSDDRAGDEPPSFAEPEWFQIARKPVTFTSAAQVALHHAAALAREQGSASIDQDHVLRALLSTGENRAVELVRECGADPESMVDMLVGTTPTSEPEDPVEPELRPTRDAMFGKGRYHHPGGLLGRAMNATIRVWPITAAPTVLVRLEVREQARRLGLAEPTTEHVVLAILAVHETLRAYPHMRPPGAAYGYLAGDVLAEAGVSYHAAREVVRARPTRLGADAKAMSYFHSRRSWSSDGTEKVLLAILTQEDSCGASLLRELGVAPSAVRERLRTRLAGR